MTRRITWLFPALLLTTGCTCHLSTQPPVEADIAEAICSVGEQSRCHVYLFFIQGHDPVDCADLECLKEMTQAMGFPRAWYGNAVYLSKFKKLIAAIHGEDEKARFVVVGYGKGVEVALELATAVETQDITIDLMICVGKCAGCPKNVARLVNVLARKEKETPEEVDGGDVHHVCAHTHQLPTHKETVDLVAKELLGLSAHIPSEMDLPKMIYPDHEPTPRPVMPPAEKAQHDDWDFLKPASVDRHSSIPPDTVPEYRPRKKKDSAEALNLPAKNAR